MRVALPLLYVLAASPALAEDVTTSEPLDTSVTIYRAPHRNRGDIALSNLRGFAVVTETRRVTLPAGESRVRFEGVTEGILAESAIVRGLPGGVLEKNRDNALLSPSALFAASIDGRVQLRRTDPRTGKARSIPASVSSASEDGIVLKTAEGYEALRCSGTAETVRFERSANGLSAVPTLSVITRSPQATTVTVTLTYITENFDWSASYTARVSPDGKTLDLGGWITLANGNSVSLKNARAQIVAGGVYRAYVERFVNAAPRVVAKCYPLGKTSDIPLKPDAPYALVRPYIEPPYDKWTDAITVQGLLVRQPNLEMAMPVSVMSAPAPPPPPPEQLGDLKMYRVPQRTTIAALQMKQTRLLEQPAVKFERFYRSEFGASWWGNWENRSNPAIIIKTKNDKDNGLGLPLPAGSIVFEQPQDGRVLLIGQPALPDKAENEDIELALGNALSVTVTRRMIQGTSTVVAPNQVSTEQAAWLRSGKQVQEFEIANAEPNPVEYELRLNTYGSQKITRATHDHIEKDGDRLFRLTLPANETVTVRYAVEE